MHARFFSFLFVALALASPFSAARADQAAEDVALGEDAPEAFVGVGDEHGIAGPGLLDGPQAAPRP